MRVLRPDGNKGVWPNGQQAGGQSQGEQEEVEKGGIKHTVYIQSCRPC